jgi:hypothetical protein
MIHLVRRCRLFLFYINQSKHCWVKCALPNSLKLAVKHLNSTQGLILERSPQNEYLSMFVTTPYKWWTQASDFVSKCDFNCFFTRKMYHLHR